MVERKSGSAKNNTNKYFRLFFSGVAGTGAFYLFLFILSFLSLKFNLSSGLYMPFGLISGAISGLLSGYTSVMPFKEKGLIYGSIGGLICIIISGTVAFAINGGKAGAGLFVLCSVIQAFSAIGGILAVSKKAKRKR